MTNIKDWYDNVTPAQVRRLAEEAETTARYIRYIVKDKAHPSLNLKARLISASLLITPDMVIDFGGDNYKRPGRPNALSDNQVKELIDDYRTTTKLTKTIAHKFSVSINTIFVHLRRNQIERMRKPKHSHLN